MRPLLPKPWPTQLITTVLVCLAGASDSAALPRSTASALAAKGVQQQTNPLNVLAPLIGTDWVADFPGGQATDTQHFEWTLGQKFVRNTHQVRSKDGQVLYAGGGIGSPPRASRPAIEGRPS